MLNLRQGRASRALSDFTEAIKTAHAKTIPPLSLFCQRGITFINLGNFDKAISDMNKAIELDRCRALLMRDGGLAYLRKDKIESLAEMGKRH